MRGLVDGMRAAGKRYVTYQEPSVLAGEPLADVPLTADRLVPLPGDSAQAQADFLRLAGVAHIGDALLLGQRGLRRVLNTANSQAPTTLPHFTYHSLLRGLHRLHLHVPLRAAIDIHETPYVDAEAIARAFPNPLDASVITGFTLFGLGHVPESYQALQVSEEESPGILTIGDLFAYSQDWDALKRVVGFRPLTRIRRLGNRLMAAMKDGIDLRAERFSMPDPNMHGDSLA